MSDSDKMQARINQLESSLTYLQADYDALNETVLENTRRLEHLKQTLEKLTSRVDDVADSLPAEALEEKPPHY